MTDDGVQAYFAKIGLDASEFLSGITAAQKGFLAFTAGITASVAVFTLAFNEYSRIVQKYGQMANDLKDLSYATGISTEEIQKFHYAAVLSGDSVGMVDAMLNKLTLSVGQFSDKTSPAAKAFAKLGVDPTGKSMSDVFLETAQALDNISDPGLRASIAIDIIGRNYRDSLPYMEDYIENQKKIKSYIGLSSADQAAASEYKQWLDELGNSWDVFWGRALGYSKQKGDWANLSDEEYKKMLASPEQQAINTMWLNMGYSQADIDAMMEREYGKVKSASDKAAKNTRIDFTNPYAGLDDTGAALYTATERLNEWNTAMEAARAAGDEDAFQKAALGAYEAQKAIDDLSKTTARSNRDNALSYREMTDITLPHLKEALDKAKASGLKTEIEKAQIALDQGVNSANDLGEALGKAAISASDIKASITIASGWSTKSKVGAAGSEMASFMVDEMQHGASYEVALAAWQAGAHSYNAWVDNAGTLGALLSEEKTSTRNPGKNEREATAAAAKTTGSESSLKTPFISSLSGKSSTPSGTTGTATTKDEVTVANEKYADLQSAYQKYIDAMLALNIKSEQNSLTHWTAETEMVRVSLENLSESWRDYVIFAAENPTIHNIGLVTWTDDGPDWTPESNPVFMQTAKVASLRSLDLSYKSADFSGIKMSASSEDTKTSSDKKTEVKVNVVVQDKTSGGVKASLASVNGGVGGRS